MPTNTLHHDKTLAALNTEAKYAKNGRRWSRYGRNGETHSTTAWQDARRRYNRAVRKASKLQLSRYHVSEPTVQELNTEYYTWEDLRTQEDVWHEEKIRANSRAV